VKPQEPQVAKKSYESPKLAVYGEVREITQNINKTGAIDAGINKT